MIAEPLDITSRERTLRAEVERLRAGIKNYLEGNYPTARKNDKCSHGRYGFEGCENCIDDYFTQLLEMKG